MSTNIHLSAIIEDNVSIGEATSIWDNVHIRYGTIIGEECIIGEKSYIAYDVRIGHRVKINGFVSICTGVTIEDGVMIAAGTIFTNDRFPRATTSDLKKLRPSEPDESTLPTLIRNGATIGAGCVIGCGLTVGQFAMIGMGSVVTRTIPDFCLALGNPARVCGVVCRCGQLLLRHDPLEKPAVSDVQCPACSLGYALTNGQITEHALNAKILHDTSSRNAATHA